MSKDIYHIEGVVKTILEGKIIHVIWEKLYKPENIYGSCEAQLKEVKAGNAEIVIIDMLNAAGTPPTECQTWFGDVLFPGFRLNPNFKGLINVLPESAIIKMGANRWKKTAASNDMGFEVYETNSSDSAKELANSLL
tara:strand:- start:72 stop:482 length:411 start_codon:yes stop_codon:yes gene_type:complete